jgi:hypothetical protein
MPAEANKAMVSPLEGQQRAGCRKTCGRGAKWTQIFGMGCSTPRRAVRQESPDCRNNGRLVHRGKTRALPCQKRQENYSKDLRKVVGAHDAV